MFVLYYCVIPSPKYQPTLEVRVCIGSIIGDGIRYHYSHYNKAATKGEMEWSPSWGGKQNWLDLTIITGVCLLLLCCWLLLWLLVDEDDDDDDDDDDDAGAGGGDDGGDDDDGGANLLMMRCLKTQCAIWRGSQPFAAQLQLPRRRCCPCQECLYGAVGVGQWRDGHDDVFNSPGRSIAQDMDYVEIGLP